MRTLSVIFSILGLICGVKNAGAVIAMPEMLQYAQPGVKSVSVRLFGDEKYHWYTTSDGYPLVRDGEFLYFATEDNRGNIVKSEYLACDEIERTDAVSAFLSALDKEALASKLIERQEKLYERKRKATLKSVHNDNFGLLANATYPRWGNQRALVILVEFTDVKFKEGYYPLDYFTRLLNEPGFSDSGATGSAKDYFVDNSNGAFDPDFDVVGPVTVPHNMAYYGGNDKYGSDSRPAEMIIDACRLVEDQVDFTEYDRDEDGVIDNIFVFYAGRGEASGGTADSIWPHAWDIREYGSGNYIFDGKRLGHYACTNERTSAGIDGIGTFVHEFSHVLGLPDLYSTEYTKAFTPGEYSVMDKGSYLNNSRTPPNYSAFERYALGWLSPEIIGGKQSVELGVISENEARIIRTNNPDEIFFIENRQPKDWDRYLPGHGMLVWHVEYLESRWSSNTVNTSLLKQHVDIVEADNIQTEQSRSGDTFPGTDNVTQLSEASHKTMTPYTGQHLNLPIVDIREQAGVVSFMVAPNGIEVCAPDSVMVKQKTTTGLTITWKGNSAKYLVTLNNLCYEVSDTVFSIDGLTPDKEYIIRVYGIDGDQLSTPSASLQIRTGDEFQPEKFGPVAVEYLGQNIYRLSWCELPDVDNVIVDIYTKEYGEPLKTVNHMSEQSQWESEGWSVEPVIPSKSDGCFGESSPSLIFFTLGGRIESPIFFDKIKAVEYWCKGTVSINAAPIIMTEGLTDSGTWETVDKRQIRPDSIGTNVVIAMDRSDIVAVRLNIECPERSRCYVDDVAVHHGQHIENVSVAGFPKAIGPSDSFTYTVNDSKDYYCQIWGEKDGLETERTAERLINDAAISMTELKNDPINISIADQGIIVTSRQQEVISIYDLSGKQMVRNVQNAGSKLYYQLPHGLYIVVSQGSTMKILLQ
ncbi:MAG: M6 family metalloprotease domain-containing protein [Muribaculaceae bacterium]|nr:M6 family metalloprotease domain-containing protein [Muribaculaceae bacterium]